MSYVSRRFRSIRKPIRRCGFIFEGCYCGLTKAHEDDHECIACDTTWPEDGRESE